MVDYEVQQYFESLDKSNIVNIELVSNAIGGRIIYPEELLDIYNITLNNNKISSLLVPFIDPNFYRAKRGVVDDDVNLLSDFLKYGLAAEISPHPLIDLEYMRFLRPDFFDGPFTAQKFLTALELNLVDCSPLFSNQFYSSHVKKYHRSKSMIIDYLLGGVNEIKGPCAYLDLDHYMSGYTDVGSTRLEALYHFINEGDKQLRRGSANDFDPQWYKNHYELGGDTIERPLWHFLRYGRYAGRAHNSDNANQPVASVIDTVNQTNLHSPSTPIEISKNYTDQKVSIYNKRRITLEQFVERDVRPVVCSTNHGEALQEVSFATNKDSILDVIIPSFNEFEYTVEALISLSRSKTRHKFNIYLVDDCSTDSRYALFGEVEGLNYIRNENNMHFLLSCNKCYAKTSAPFLLLLNNDAQLYSDTIEILMQPLIEDKNIAASVPMILYPNGRLQEAGCSISADGSTKMVGVGDDPSLPAYNYQREVDYGSGACLLLRRSDVGTVLFDEQFAPAYCEDADLCFRLKQQGGKIVYVPAAKCVHHLSVSTNKNSEMRRIQNIRINQQKFMEKWSYDLINFSKPRILAFYLPQFHPIAENNLWWGKGFTEWTNVAKSQASFLGHYQPHLPADLGFYDLRIVDNMQEQMKLARRYSIEGFVMYYYNFSGKRVLHTPLDNILNNHHIDFNFTLCWANENWTAHWDGGSQKDALMIQDYDDQTFEVLFNDFIAAAKHPGAIKIDGKPFMLIYRPLLIPHVKSRCDELRLKFSEAGFPEIHLSYVESMETLQSKTHPSDIGFDSCVEFPPQGVAEPYKGTVKPLKSGLLAKLYSYEDTVSNACARKMADYKRFPGAFPSWDNTARQPLGHTTLVGAAPERFQAYVEAKLEELNEFHVGQGRILFVNAWNEWAEGAHLEPDQTYGHDWLRAISDACSNYS